MSVRHATAATTLPTRALADVLATGKREAEATGVFFGKSDPVKTFRKAVTELDDKKAEKGLKKSFDKLTSAQTQALVDEYEKAEAKAWEGVEKVAVYSDYHKKRKANIEALEGLLKAQAGLGALYQYGMREADSAMPNRPEMPDIYRSQLWPSFKVTKGEQPWKDYRHIRDSWKKAGQEVYTVGQRK